MKRERSPFGNVRLVVILFFACFLTACGGARANVVTWPDIQVQQVNVAKISGRDLRVDVNYLILFKSQETYPFFFHLTDPSGNLVAQLDARETPTYFGETFTRQYTIRLPPAVAGRLRILMGRYDPADGSRVPTVGGLNEVQVGAIEMP